MGKLLIISNRLPISIIKRENEMRVQPSVGGLATGLRSFYKKHNCMWVGWPGLSSEKIKKETKDEITEKLANEDCFPVFLSKRDVEDYYYGFSNKTIWPLFHYFPMYTVWNKASWKAYKRVNEIFCNKVIKVAEKGDTIWVHDYHLMLLPMLLREKIPDAAIGFFLHIPFPSFEMFRLLPWRRELLEGLLGADLIGFHIYDYVRHFLDTVSGAAGYEHTFGQINVGNRLVKADAFPMGIDYERFATATDNSKVQKEIKRICKKVGKRRIVLSIDRMDYSKGISQRLEAFSLFLDNYPEYKEKVTLILVAVPSRTKVEHYRLLKKQLDELIGKINGEHGTIGWMPIWYLYCSLPFHNLAALYSITDVAFITPLRDGMNLIAKEFVSTKTDGKGVLILSEMAGAAKELGEAIIVNPNSKEEMAKSLKEALEMSEDEQIEHNRIMQRRLQRYNVRRWANDFIDSLNHIKQLQQEFAARRVTYEMKKKMIKAYLKSKKRLIFLDYDGTLIPFTENPRKAKPDDELLELLKLLVLVPKNQVVIISGRDKDTLDNWFGDLKVGLIAEHGIWIKEKNKGWEAIELLRNEWKEEIRPFLELYTDRTPGSFMEEKEFSLVWHYRKADPELASVRARELKDALLHRTANLNLGVLEGSKVIEIKNAGINKGRAALYWMSKKKWDFILAIGDDWTDEDVFAVLPDTAYSIKVGLCPSQARFNVESYVDVRALLKTFVE